MSASPPPLVSIVIIFKDAERFLEEAIASVLAQSYPAWELLLVDDGSVDAGTRIARTYTETMPARIRYLEHPGHENRGMSASRNAGAAAARGAYLAFLDADDVYLPHKLSHQVGLLEAHPGADMVWGPTEYWYSWSGREDDRTRDRLRRRGVSGGRLLPPGTLLASLIQDDAQTPCTCGVLLRTRAFASAGGFEERFRGMYEDQVFFLKAFTRLSVLTDDRCCDRYRQHPESHVNQAKAAGRWHTPERPSPVREDFQRWLQEFIAAEGIADAVHGARRGGDGDGGLLARTGLALEQGVQRIRGIGRWIASRLGRRAESAVRKDAPPGPTSRS